MDLNVVRYDVARENSDQVRWRPRGERCGHGAQMRERKAIHRLHGGDRRIACRQPADLRHGEAAATQRIETRQGAIVMAGWRGQLVGRRRRFAGGVENRG